LRHTRAFKVSDDQTDFLENMAVGRKLFRLFKSINEYVNIKKFLQGDLPPVDKYFSVATRLAFLFYWVFDNLGVLVKIKFV
jgi:hypothetical protein